jgi:phenylalanine-4-hydroxylase
MERNEIIDKLPKHLMSLVIDQPYNSYTPQDHALWRFVMRQNVKYLTKVAHGSYLDGLKKTGISIEQIPHMYGMNRILKEIGWAAVAVDGFIPPAGFMEFQAHNVLVIAADIRPIDQIGYTPAPDIIHEAAGHAPIIADPEYANYLRRFGEIGCKALQSAKDYEMYEAIRHLSILKADPYTPKEDIDKANEKLNYCANHLGEPSEMALIRNLHWWTVEYGLIGDLKNPKIYGAGLLSSISESYNCLQPKVKKLPYNLDAVNYSFDITEQQPQLFVTPDFNTLTDVLEQFADTMALRKGGLDGIRKAIDSKNTATCEYSSGLQVSGTFTEVIENKGEPVYLKATGPTSLSFCNTELPGHDKGYHSHGFSSPIGKIKGMSVEPEYATVEDLKKLGIVSNQQVEFEFESGIKVKGILRNSLRKEGRLILLSFSDCYVKYKDQDLFLPDWGMFDMAVGSKIISVFNGPADSDAFGLEYPVPVEKTHKIVHSEKAKQLNQLYQKVRDIRERNCSYAELPKVWDDVKDNHPEDWLCSIEILELLKEKGIEDEFYNEVMDFLLAKQQQSPELKKLIDDGFAMLN